MNMQGFSFHAVGETRILEYSTGIPLQQCPPARDRSSREERASSRCETRVPALAFMEQTIVSIPSYPLDNSVCPVACTARIISGKWTLLIIRDLTSGVKRFSQLERSLKGISPKTLSERLHSLEEEGILLRQVFAEVPPRVEYSLTEKGHDLVDVIACMRCYGKRWLCNPDQSEPAPADLAR